MIARFFRWTCSWFQQWLQGEAPVSMVLDVYYQGRPERVRAIAVVGLRIQCLITSLGQQRAVYHLISVGHAVDASHFWRVWRELGGQEMVWEDGTPFQPH